MTIIILAIDARHDNLPAATNGRACKVSFDVHISVEAVVVCIPCYFLPRIVYLASELTQLLSCCLNLFVMLALLLSSLLTPTMIKTQSLDLIRAYGTIPGDLSQAMEAHRYIPHYISPIQHS